MKITLTTDDKFCEMFCDFTNETDDCCFYNQNTLHCRTFNAMLKLDENTGRILRCEECLNKDKE